jgi:hypothetical protein
MSTCKRRNLHPDRNTQNDRIYQGPEAKSRNNAALGRKCKEGKASQDWM